MSALPSDRATAVEPVPVSPLRDGIPSARLTALEVQTLKAWDQCSVGYGFCFKTAAKHCETPPHLIRRVVRSLARKGMLAYARTLYEEDEPRISAGYTLTKAGAMLLGILALEEVPS